MARRPDDIRIEDLANPVLTDIQKMAVDAVSSMAPVQFSRETVLAAARERTGLDDFGAPDFLERLDVYLRAVDEDPGLNALGRRIAHGNCVRYLANRLLLEDLLERHPEIHDVEIRRPIIIAGLPRSGTTHLVNLISADQRLRSMPYWESMEPVPTPGERPTPEGEDPRLARCRKSCEQQDALMPLLRAMHHMTPEHVHEEIEVQELDFSTYNLEWNAHVPRWRDFYLSYDHTPHYEYLRKVLKAMQWLRGPDRWVLKSPQHLEHLPALHSIFPDATLAITHRDPAAVIVSAITMLAYGDRVRRSKVDPAAVAAYWIDRVERLLRACVRDRDVWPASQSIDVLFHEFMSDDVAMVARIYELADLPLTDEARAQFETFMAQNPRGKHGRVVYELDGDFGVDADELRDRFGFYFERFPIHAGS